MTTKVKTTILKVILIFITGVTFMVSTWPIVYGTLRYWGINQSIKEKEVIADQIASRGGDRTEADEQLRSLQAKKKEMAETNDVINFCFSNSKTNFAKESRDYFLRGKLFTFILGMIAIAYSIYKAICLITQKDESTFSVQEQERIFDGEAFIEDVQSIQSGINKRCATAEEVIREIDRIKEEFERYLED